jgi:hypothetical protein
MVEIGLQRRLGRPRIDEQRGARNRREVSHTREQTVCCEVSNLTDNLPLFLSELQAEVTDRQGAHAVIQRVADAISGFGGELLEAAVTSDHVRVFAVARVPDRDVAVMAARETGLRFSGPDPVRLVRATEDQVRASRQRVRYLVEWDFPTGLTMDAYLARKRTNARRYAEVPEVSFLRTYVREDMSKCLCLYDANCEGDVRHAREVVDAPVSRLHELAQSDVHSRAR